MYDAGRLPHADNLERTAVRCVRATPPDCGWKPSWAMSAASRTLRRARTLTASARIPTRQRTSSTGRESTPSRSRWEVSHAMANPTARLDHDLIARLHDRLAVPLVLHGSSGVSSAELRRAVAAGIAKINVGTALNVALTQSIRTTLDAQPDLVDPRRFLAPARDAMTARMTAVLHSIS